MTLEGFDSAIRVTVVATVDLSEDVAPDAFEAIGLPTVEEVVPVAVEVAVLDTGVVCVLAGLAALVTYEELLSLF